MFNPLATMSLMGRVHRQLAQSPAALPARARSPLTKCGTVCQHPITDVAGGVGTRLRAVLDELSWCTWMKSAQSCTPSTQAISSAFARRRWFSAVTTATRGPPLVLGYWARKRSRWNYIMGCQVVRRHVLLGNVRSGNAESS